MATAHTGTRAAEAGFELHVRRDDARGQLAAFFTAPPHDVLASRFSLQLVCGEREGANATTETRRLVRAAANRVHFFSLKSEQGAGSCDNLADAGDLWLQLLVERSGASAMGPAEVVAAVFAGTASQPQQPCTRQKWTPADERNLVVAAARRDERRASFGTASTGSAARRRRSLRELRQFAQRVCAFWVCLFVCLCCLCACVCRDKGIQSYEYVQTPTHTCSLPRRREARRRIRPRSSSAPCTTGALSQARGQRAALLRQGRGSRRRQLLPQLWRQTRH